MKLDLCTDCKKRNDCAALCKEAEKYVNQDWIGQRETLMPNFDQYVDSRVDLKPWPELPEKSFLTKREKEVVSRLLDGKSRNKIAQELNITRENLKKIIQSIRRKRERKLPII